MKISNKALNDLFWMSMRYCIGRHTIAATNHAYEIANIIYDNPGALSNFELTRLAIDIRDEKKRNKLIRTGGSFISVCNSYK